MATPCRVCGSSEISAGTNYRPYKNIETVYYDCNSCGCRFVSRDEFIYEQLHASDSTYSAHRELSNEASRLFDRGDLDGLGKYLCLTPKNRPIIEHLQQAANCQRVLEFGCSRGYLSSYAILMGKEFYGVDISETAIAAAAESFGATFLLERDLGQLEGKDFDLIYHVGTIGCVDYPVEFIKTQLDMLRPGGSLIFNAPNVEACRVLGLDWLIGTTPPDLVTLFPPRFWKQQFSDLAQVEVRVSNDAPLQSYQRRRYARQTHDLSSRELFAARNAAGKRNPLSTGVRQLAKKLINMFPPLGPFAPLPQEFGVYVKMTSR